MKVAVKDANILIDLVNGGLLEAALRLPYDFVTTDSVLLQLEVESQWEEVRPFVEKEVIKIAHLTGEELAGVAMDPLLERFGVADLETLWVAFRERGILLTGDWALRIESKHRKVEVHGLLWVLDQLLQDDLLQPEAAAKKLRLIIAMGARLPQTEVMQRLALWERKKEK